VAKKATYLQSGTPMTTTPPLWATSTLYYLLSRAISTLWVQVLFSWVDNIMTGEFLINDSPMGLVIPPSSIIHKQFGQQSIWDIFTFHMYPKAFSYIWHMYFLSIFISISVSIYCICTHAHIYQLYLYHTHICLMHSYLYPYPKVMAKIASHDGVQLWLIIFQIWDQWHGRMGVNFFNKINGYGFFLRGSNCNNKGRDASSHEIARNS